jgi:long-chain acyl-CoA synthetase
MNIATEPKEMTAQVGVPGPATALAGTNAVQLFVDRVRKSGLHGALRRKRDGVWRETTWSDWDRTSREIAAGLQGLGVVTGDRVCLLANSRPEWVECDVGILMAGAVTVPIYQSNLSHECEYVMNDSGARVLFAENPEQVKKAIAERGKLTNIERVVYFDERQRLDKPDAQGRTTLTIEDVVPAEARAWVMSIEALREAGRTRLARPGEVQALERSWAEIAPDAPFTIVYTSGTTGPPKGVVLTHKNIVFECGALGEVLAHKEGDEQLMFLPLAHIFAKVLEWMTIARGSRIAFAESIPQLKANLAEVRPVFMCSVPRVLEKVYLGILGNRNAAPPLRQKVFDWAFSVGRRVSALERAHQPLPPLLAVQRAIAHKLVFAKIHAVLGGQLRYMVSGGAPLSKEIAEFFHAAGILILEGWGLTESTAGATVNRPDDFAFGTVGVPVRGCEVKIAPDGEILLRGDLIMRGYWNKPEATAEVLEPDGWFHTGDIGVLEGNKLKITDRKKDIIVNSGGKNIAPQNLEGFLKATPYISQVMVHGDKRPYLVALITLNEENVRTWAKQNGLGAQALAQLAEDAQLRTLVQGYVDQLNQREPSYSSIKRFAILPQDFSQDTGELTPTLKVKRKFCYEKYRTLIDGLYSN